MMSQLSSRNYRVVLVYLFNCFMHEKLIVTSRTRKENPQTTMSNSKEFNRDLKFPLLNRGIWVGVEGGVRAPW